MEITRTNGQNGIDWSRISIIVDGDNEGDTVCTSTSTYGCTYQSVGELWESGETITVKEMNDNLHEGYYDIQIIIMIDGVGVYAVDVDLQ